MATTNTPTTIAAYLKEVYDGDITQLVPKSTPFLKRAKFKQDMEPGEKAVFSVQLSHEAGFSCGTGSVTLNAAVAHTSAKAEVDGKNVVLRSRISYDAASKASSSKKAFARWNEQKFIPMVESYNKRLEILCLWGGDSLGVVESNTSGALVITAATFAPGIWLGSEGTVLEAFTALSGGSQHNTDLTISAVDIDTRTVTVTGTSAAVAANDYLFYKGHRGTEPTGLAKIAKNATTLYNIDAAAYGLWKANAYDAGTSALTFGKVIGAAAKSANKGCDENLVLLCSQEAFTGLVSDQAAFRKYDASYKAAKGENGFKSLVFHTGAVEVEIVPTIYMKRGEAIMFPERHTCRIGSSDVTMKMPGKADEELVLQVADSTDYEMRLYSDQTVFCERPGWITRITRSDSGVL